MPNNTPAYVNGNTATMQFAADTDPFIRMKIDSSGYAAIAGVGEESVGVNWDGAVDISENVYGTVRYDHASGQQLFVAAGAVSIGADVYPAASGKVSATSVGKSLGKAVTAATADGDIIAVVPAGAEGAVKFIEESFVIGDFTDNTNTTGYVDTAESLPAGALVLGWQANVATGFTGDTTASAQLGVAANLNQFTTTAPSVLAAAIVGSASPGSGDSPVVAAASAARLTVTGAADFTSISAGALTLKIAYIPMA